MKEKWQKRVYRRKIKNYMSRDDWQKLRMACLRRDNFSCQRCEFSHKQGRGLQAHHMNPRDEGGADDITNLITLCNPCHDFVEIEGLKNFAEIVGSYGDAPIKLKPQKGVKDVDYSFERTKLALRRASKMRRGVKF